MENRTTIELDDYEANLFLEFRKHYNQINKILQKEVFDKDFTGRVILNIKDGQIGNMEKYIAYHYKIEI